MIPFARLLKYGNVINVAEIVDIQVSRSHTLVLDSTGNLWGRGTNTNNILNQQNPLSTTATFVLVQSGVQLMFCGYQYTLYVKDGILYKIGASLTWDSGVVTTPRAISTPFSASLIKKIQCVTTTSAMILLTDGTLWFNGAGTNGRFGNGAAATVSQWTKSAQENIKDMYHKFIDYEGSTAYSVILKNDGTVYGTGSIRINASTGFGFSTYISTLSWVQRPVSSNIKEIACGCRSVMLLDNDDNLYGDGNGNSEFTGVLSPPTYNNTMIASGVKLFGLNYESSYYVLKSTPTVLSTVGRNSNLTSSFSSLGSYMPRVDNEIGVQVKKIYTPSIDMAASIQYISLIDNTVILGGSSYAYQLGVNTGNVQLQKGTLPGVVV